MELVEVIAEGGRITEKNDEDGVVDGVTVVAMIHEEEVQNDVGDNQGDSEGANQRQTNTATSSSSSMLYRQEIVNVSKIAYPIILSEVFQNTLPVMDIAFVGWLGKDELGAAALATVWFNLWNSSMMGFMTAIDTMLAQTFGANQYESYGIWTGTSLLIVLVTTAFCISPIIAICDPLMRLFGQDPALADEAGKFALRLIPGLFPYYLFKVLTKYLQSQNKLAPSVWIGILANGMNAFFNWVLIYALDWGIRGAPWATTLTRLVEFILIVIYIYSQKLSTSSSSRTPALSSSVEDSGRSMIQATWPRLSKENLQYSVLKPFWKIAISGALSISAEAWSFEITTILAGLLGTTALDAHIITFSIATFIYLSFPFAVGIASSIRVGQLIGDRQPMDAKRSCYTSLGLSAGMQAILVIILLPCKDIIGDGFSNDQDVAKLVSELIPISCIFMMGDAVQATIGGALRGLGRQRLVLWLNILGFWIFAVPIGSILTFQFDLGVHGLWWGMVVGIYGACLIGIGILRFHVDWQSEAKKAIKRINTTISSSTPQTEQ